MSSRMPCPKCGGGGATLIDRRTAWKPTPNGVEYSCTICGFRQYGQKAMANVIGFRAMEYRAMEYRAMQEYREALLKSMLEKQAQRLAEARSREAQLRKGISTIRKEEARIPREAESRLAEEAEEARRASLREYESQQAALRALYLGEATRIAETRALQGRERGARYRAKKRAERLAATATEPALRSGDVSPTELLTEVPPAYPVVHLNLVLEVRVSEPGEEAPESDKCAWHECYKPHTDISKYCSRDCSVKNSRARARARKMGPLDLASSAK